MSSVVVGFSRRAKALGQVEKEGPQEVPQISEEEKAHVIDKAMVGITLIEVGIRKLEFLLAGCLSYSENKMLDSWYKRADEAIDRDDLDTTLQYAEKIVKFLEERKKQCEDKA